MALPCIICFHPIPVNNGNVKDDNHLTPTLFIKFYNLLVNYLFNTVVSKEESAKITHLPPPLEGVLRQDEIVSCKECLRSMISFCSIYEQEDPAEGELIAEVMRLKTALERGLDNSSKKFPETSGPTRNTDLSLTSAMTLVSNIGFINQCTRRLQCTTFNGAGAGNDKCISVPGSSATREGTRQWVSNNAKGNLTTSPIMLPALEIPVSSEISRFQPRRRDPATEKYKCELCVKEFQTIAAYKTHYDKVHLQLTYKCAICKQELHTQVRYRNHFKLQHMTTTTPPVGPTVSSVKNHLVAKDSLPGPSSSYDYFGPGEINHQTGYGTGRPMISNTRQSNPTFDNRHSLNEKTVNANNDGSEFTRSIVYNTDHYAEPDSARGKHYIHKKAKLDTITKPNDDVPPSTSNQMTFNLPPIAHTRIPPIYHSIRDWEATLPIRGSNNNISNMYAEEAGASNYDSSQWSSDDHGPTIYVGSCVYCGLFVRGVDQLTKHMDACRPKHN